MEFKPEIVFADKGFVSWFENLTVFGFLLLLPLIPIACFMLGRLSKSDGGVNQNWNERQGIRLWIATNGTTRYEIVEFSKGQLTSLCGYIITGDEIEPLRDCHFVTPANFFSARYRGTNTLTIKYVVKEAATRVLVENPNDGGLMYFHCQTPDM